MRKKHEIGNPGSCLSRAGDEEMLFTLRGKDAVAPLAIRFWISERIRTGKNQPGDPQVSEAEECARTMERERAAGKYTS
jgi:hypothetical protein